MKRIFCALLACCLLLCCTACKADVDLEEVKTAMVTRLALSPTDLDADKAEQWYGITADNCEQAIVFTLTENRYPAEIVMVRAVDEEAAQLIAATTSRRLSSLKSQSPDRSEQAISCTIGQSGTYVTMFFSEQSAAMQAIYEEYVK